MSSNAYMFSVVVALIGMATVFVGLSVMSLMMILLRRIFRSEGSRIPGEAPPPLKASIRPVSPDTRWVIAAVAAYLSEEAQQTDRSAARWQPPADAKQDPWINQTRM